MEMGIYAGRPISGKGWMKMDPRWWWRGSTNATKSSECLKICDTRPHGKLRRRRWRHQNSSGHAKKSSSINVNNCCSHISSLVQNFHGGP